MRLFNLSRGLEQPSQPILRRVPEGKNDGPWTPAPEEERGYQDDPKIIEKIRRQRKLETQDYQKN